MIVTHSPYTTAVMPDKRSLSLFFPKDIEEYSRESISFPELAMRPATSIREIAPYWGLKVQNKETKEWRRFDRLQIEGEYSFRWWYDNYETDSRSIGVPIFSDYRPQ